MREILLARPSSLIVNDMKKLMNAAGVQATPLQSLADLVNYFESNIAGIVVSTALSSPVKEKYWEVILRVVKQFPKKPIFLASYASVKSTKVTAAARFSEFAIERKLVSIEEVDSNFSSEKDILILTQSEISDPSQFEKILAIVKRIIASH